MCEDWFGYEGAEHVLDPVMLLDAEVYRTLAQKAENHSCRGKVMTYILDPSREKACVVDFVARITGKDVEKFFVDDSSRPLVERVAPPVEQWLASFCDADFVVTDSFHGCVLSILMHKKFLAVGNSRRGMARLSSLLNMFGLEGRLVHGIDPEDDGEYFLSDIDWEAVDEKLKAFKEESMKFLLGAL